MEVLLNTNTMNYFFGFASGTNVRKTLFLSRRLRTPIEEELCSTYHELFTEGLKAQKGTQGTLKFLCAVKSMTVVLFFCEWSKGHQETSDAKNFVLQVDFIQGISGLRGYKQSPLGLHHSSLSNQLFKAMPIQPIHPSFNTTFQKSTITCVTTLSVYP